MLLSHTSTLFLVPGQEACGSCTVSSRRGGDGARRAVRKEERIAIVDPQVMRMRMARINDQEQLLRILSAESGCLAVVY